MEKFFAN